MTLVPMREATAISGIKHHTIRRYIADGVVAGERPATGSNAGGQYVVDLDSLANWLRSKSSPDIPAAERIEAHLERDEQIDTLTRERDEALLRADIASASATAAHNDTLRAQLDAVTRERDALRDELDSLKRAFAHHLLGTIPAAAPPDSEAGF